MGDGGNLEKIGPLMHGIGQDGPRMHDLGLHYLGPHFLGQVGQRMRERRYREILDDPPECSLAELRRSSLRSQATVAAALGVRQIAVSRLERRPDVLVSTLSDYVEALGGNLELIVRFPRRAARIRLPDPHGAFDKNRAASTSSGRPGLSEAAASSSSPA